MQVQTDDVGGLLLEVRIIGGHVAVEPLGLEAVLAPHSGDHHVGDTQFGTQFAGAPMGRGTRLTLDRPFENASFQLWGKRARLLTGMAAKQTRQALLVKALAPPINEVIVAGELLADLGPRIPARKQQNQARPASAVGSAGLTHGSLAQFHAFHLRQFDRAAHEHNHTPYSVVTVH